MLWTAEAPRSVMFMWLSSSAACVFAACVFGKPGCRILSAVVTAVAWLWIGIALANLATPAQTIALNAHDATFFSLHPRYEFINMHVIVLKFSIFGGSMISL